jgi:hypothetical protein
MARDPFAGEEPGIDLHFAYGYVRTGRADVLAERSQRWLDSPEATNLIESLGLSEADERHAALWLSTEAEARSAREQGTLFCPATPMSLPSGLDVLWLFVGSVVVRYDGSWVSAPIGPVQDA